jgi:photosystem II stability/assembly factor-like uncharacterized protein
MNVICRLAVCLPALLLAQPSSPAVSVTRLEGRCVRCARAYQLGRFQFVTSVEGWATASQIIVSGGHVSQYSGVLHTSNSGKSWTPESRVETYGVDVEPAFWFVNSREGWIGWPTASEPFDHLRRTMNGGRRWIDLSGTLQGAWVVHLRFFDSNLGYSAVSTLNGPQFGLTRDGGRTWSFRTDPRLSALRYPEVLFFLNASVGWIGGSSVDGSDVRPRLVGTTDGGATWREASFPPSLKGNPRDLFFLDPDRGWLVLWNTDGPAFLRTTDGGHSWIEESNWIIPGHGSLPYAVRYLSASVGVLLIGKAIADGSDPTGGRGDSEALVTRDTGRTWSRYELPAAVQSCEVVVDEVWCSSGMDLLKIRVHP